MRKRHFLLTLLLMLISIGSWAQGFVIYEGDKAVATYEGTEFQAMMLKDCPTLTSALTISGVSSLDIGSSATLSATVTPSGASTVLKWSSSNASVATVDKSSGTVTGVADGTVTITATSTDGTQLSATHSITVTAPALSSGRFTVGVSKIVQFTTGNLRATYDGSGYTWSLSPHQYDYVGNAAGNTTIGSSQTSGAVVDLFGWSVNKDATQQPVTTTTNDYGLKASTEAADYEGLFADWGLMDAFNDSKYALLSDAEWTYLLTTREVNGGTGDGYSYKHTVLTLKGGSEVSGLLIFPDDYSTSSYPTPGTSTSWSDWQKMEKAGTVFLPDGGSRSSTTVTTGSGNYWSNASDGTENAYYMGTTGTVGSQYRYKGCNVRFVSDIPQMSDGKFRVSDTKEVQFTTGNLQAKYDNGTAKYTFGFASHQYDCIGSKAGNTTIDSQQDNAVVDLFGWSTDNTNSNYGINTLTDASSLIGSFKDWSTIPELSTRESYATLSKAEWDYLLNTREVNGGTGEGHSYKYTTLTTSSGTQIAGLLIVPGDFSGTLGTATTWSEWQTLEKSGVIFLPMAGSRSGSSVTTGAGGYWTATGSDVTASYVSLAATTATSEAALTTGYSVRLVKDSPTAVTGFGISQTSMTLLKVGATRTLTANVQPDNATDKTVAWSSDNDAIATVSTDGTITAKSAGTCTITARPNGNSSLKATCAVTVETSPLSKESFSVSGSKQVYFARTNTYWDGDSWEFEDNAWDYQTGWNEAHVNLFNWSKDAGTMYAKDYTETTGATTDSLFFCYTNRAADANKVGGDAGYFTLSGGQYTSDSDWQGEWDYLLNKRTVSGGTGEGHSYQRTTLTLSDGSSTVYGLLIFPDSYSSATTPGTTTTWSDWETMETAGVVFLPAAGGRSGTTFAYQGTSGSYWTSSPKESGSAYGMSFTSDGVYAYFGYSRALARSLRLVQEVKSAH